MAAGFVVVYRADIFCVDLPPFWIYVLGLCFATVFRFVLQDCVSGPYFVLSMHSEASFSSWPFSASIESKRRSSRILRISSTSIC